MFILNVLYKFASMIIWLVDKKALMMQFIVCKTEKATSLKNISSMQDTAGVMIYCQRAIRAKTLGWGGGSRIEPRKTGQ